MLLGSGKGGMRERVAEARGQAPAARLLLELRVPDVPLPLDQSKVPALSRFVDLPLVLCAPRCIPDRWQSYRLSEVAPRRAHRRVHPLLAGASHPAAVRPPQGRSPRPKHAIPHAAPPMAYATRVLRSSTPSH